MVPEVKVIEHVNNVVRSVAVLLAQFVQNAHLDQCLMMKALLVANYFDGHVKSSFVVQRTNHLTKTAFANHLENLVAIADVVVNDLK